MHSGFFCNTSSKYGVAIFSRTTSEPPSVAVVKFSSKTNPEVTSVKGTSGRSSSPASIISVAQPPLPELLNKIVKLRL